MMGLKFEDLDEDLKALFEESFRRNRKAYENLAKK